MRFVIRMQDVIATCMPQKALGGHRGQGFIQRPSPLPELADNGRETSLALVRSHSDSIPESFLASISSQTHSSV
jgi:hypothetical protein